MADIRPFRGVRYDRKIVGDLANVVSAPYDIISPPAQESYYARSPHNVVRLEFGIEHPSDSVNDNRYTRASTQYQAWRKTGALLVEPRPTLYLYDETFVERGLSFTRRAILAPVRLARWDENVVLPHEFTMSGPKIDRLNLLRATHTQFSPLLTMYEDSGEVRAIVADVTAVPPVAEFTLGPGFVAAAAAKHRVWCIDSPEALTALQRAFEPLQIFIADGHHRYETALAYRDERRAAGASAEAASEFVLMSLVEMSDPGLLVLPTHRMLRGLGAIDTGRMLTALGERFTIEAIPLAGRNVAELVPPAATSDTSAKIEFVLLGIDPGVAHRLTLRSSIDLAQALPEVPKELRTLDTVILQRMIFAPLFGLTDHDAEAGEKIRYTRDPEDALRALATGDSQLAFLLGGTSVAQIRDAARAGHRMPQKSTYFYPKPVTGVVFFDHDIDA